MAEAFRRCYYDASREQEIISLGNETSKKQRDRRFLCLFLLAVALTLFRVSGVAAQSDPSDKLPMYGQPGIARPESLKKIDEDLIRDATFRFGNRQAASRALAEQGWASVRKGILDTAMRRFNEAWLPKKLSSLLGVRSGVERARKIGRGH